MNSYLHLTSRLYPCGECATEFQELLKKFPPQVNSLQLRSSSTKKHSTDRIKISSKSMVNSTFFHNSSLAFLHEIRLCSIHNKVNERLGKPSFDCAHLDETYDCGCGDDKSTSATQQSALSDSADDPMDLEWDAVRDDVTGVGMIKGGKR